MLITDVQERIMGVFSRVTKSLSKEFQEINLGRSFQERIPFYDAIKTEFKNYSPLAEELVREVNSNLASDLRPAERERYIKSLNSYQYELKDGYEYIESDEWIDRIFADFQMIIVFGPQVGRTPLTADDKKLIFEVADEVRACCYEYVKAADAIASIIHDFLVAHAIPPLGKSQITSSLQQNGNVKFEKEATLTSATQEQKPKELGQENDQLNTKSRVDRTENSNLPVLDFIVVKAKILARSSRNSSLGMNFLIYEDLMKYTEYFLIENRKKWDSDNDELNDELNRWFIQQSDSKVQDRFANSLITHLFQLFGPLWRDLDSIVDYSQDPSREKSQEYINENGEFCNTIRYTVQNWLFCIRENILHFAPERYAESKVLLTQLIPFFKVYDEEYDYIPSSQLHQPGVKLQLKCSPAIAGYIISELIRGDYIEAPLRHGSINYTELGRICSQIFNLPKQYKTNAEGWRKVIDVDSNSGNQLTDIKRSKLKLPDRTDLE
ncbi:hypothetical protein [Spirosoma areae]